MKKKTDIFAVLDDLLGQVAGYAPGEGLPDRILDLWGRQSRRRRRTPR